MKRYSIKLHQEVYDRLCQFQGKKETFNQAVDRLLKVWEGFHSLSQVVGGMHEFADWKDKQRQVNDPAQALIDLRDAEVKL